MTRAARTWGLADAGMALLAVVVAACGSPRVPPSAEAATATPPSQPAGQVTERPANALGFERVSISADGLFLTLTFTGGAPYVPRDWCTNAYAGWAALAADGVLEAAAVDVTPPPTASGATPAACDAVGHERSVTIRLAEPYAGWRVRDIADGRIHIARAPDTIVDLVGLDTTWSFDREQETAIELGTTPVWERQWARVAAPQGPSSPGSLVLYQGFGAATGITGGPERHDVDVGGRPGVLYRTPDTGELIVVWLLDGDGIALDANEADFTPEALLQLAATVRHP